MPLESSFWIALNWPWIRKMTMTSQFFDMTSFLIFFDVAGPGFMSISLLVLDLWQFFFIKDWLEISKSEIARSEFCLISGDWRKLGWPNLARMSFMKFYLTLQNTKVTVCTVCALLRENQHGGAEITPSHLD